MSEPTAKKQENINARVKMAATMIDAHGAVTDVKGPGKVREPFRCAVCNGPGTAAVVVTFTDKARAKVGKDCAKYLGATLPGATAGDARGQTF